MKLWTRAHDLTEHDDTATEAACERIAAGEETLAELRAEQARAEARLASTEALAPVVARSVRELRRQGDLNHFGLMLQLSMTARERQT